MYVLLYNLRQVAGVNSLLYRCQLKNSCSESRHTNQPPDHRHSYIILLRTIRPLRALRHRCAPYGRTPQRFLAGIASYYSIPCVSQARPRKRTELKTFNLHWTSCWRSNPQLEMCSYLWLQARNTSYATFYITSSIHAYPPLSLFCDSNIPNDAFLGLMDPVRHFHNGSF